MKLFFFSVFLLVSSFHPAYALSVEQAYKSIPHAQTNFNVSASAIEPLEALFLQSFFTLVNRAIVERVQTLRWLQTNGAKGSDIEHYMKNISVIIHDFERMHVPKSLESPYQLVLNAVKQQAQYFQNWSEKMHQGKGYRFNRSDPAISQSHSQLIQAYNLLMNTFKQEQRNNKQAFFDHLCALDFI